MRLLTIVMCVHDPAAAWIAGAIAAVGPVFDPETASLDDGVDLLAMVLFMATVGTALGLIVMGRLPKTALTLAIMFSSVLIILLVAAAIIFA